MTDTTTKVETTQMPERVADQSEREEQVSQPRGWKGAARLLSLDKFSALYVWVALCIYFSITLPSLFPTMANLRNVLASQSVTALVTIALIYSLATGVFDLSIQFSIGVVGVFVAQALQHGWSPEAACALGLAIAFAIGVLNVVVVVGMGIDSFIGTLATGSVLEAIALRVSNNNLLTNFPNSFVNIANGQFLGIARTFWALLVVAVLSWYVLEHTPFGRKLYIVGASADAARLAGIRVPRVRAASLMITAMGGGVAAVFLTSQLGSATADMGTGYLLPGFAAAFLGATQVKPGRQNVWGAMIAILVLGTGVAGLQLGGAQVWVSSLFYGIALIVAVGLTVAQKKLAVRRRINQLAKLREETDTP
jgi:ribose transport system permease protein